MHNISQDHQDGLGTCFANSAKNILIGLSGGEINASFLDLAVQYKSKYSQGKPFQLDLGNTCDALSVVKEKGYCPKEFSPIESGDDTHNIRGLIKENSSLNSHAEVIGMLKRFMDGKELLENNTESCSLNMVKNSKKMIEAMKNDPDIKIPYPLIDRFPLDKSTMLGFYFWNYKDIVSNPVSQEEYLNDYNRVNEEFSKSYLEASVREDSKEKLQKRFDETFGKFFTKYGFSDKLKESYHVSRLKSFMERGYDQKYKNEAIKTNLFYKEFFSEGNDTISLSNSSCVKNNRVFSSFLSVLNEMANLFRATGGAIDKLYDDEGNFISSHDLMMLAVAPKCINRENRKEINLEYSCKHIYTNQAVSLDEEIINKRKVILTSLLEGIPVGNGHKVDGGGHINSIVGHRFNASLNQCEYKIRESLTATSFWVSEKDVLKTNIAFVLMERE